MKYHDHVFLAAAIFAAIGCSVESSEAPAYGPEQVEAELIADFADPDTRTVRQADGSVNWVAGDEISLFFGDGTDGGNRFTTSTSGPSASFRGKITAYTAGGEDYAGGQTYFWGVYPYDSLATCDNSSVTTTLHSVQTGVAGTFSPGQNVSVGKAENLKMSFFNVCSGFKFSLTKEGIRFAEFASIGGESLVGSIRVTMEDGAPAATIIGDAESTVTLVPEGGEFQTGVSYYVEFIPGTLASGFTASFYTDTQMGVFTYGNSRYFQRSVFTNVNNIDTRISEWVTRPGNIPVEDANFKTYLVAYFDTDRDGEISYAEAGEITRIAVCTDSISSVKGIEYMPKLNSLSVYGSSRNSTTGSTGKLTALDVSKNTALTTLSCDSNQLTSLDVSKNTALTYLSCHSKLTSLDVSKNTALTRLYCYSNQLTSLDVSKNTALALLWCFSNQLTSLDVLKNTALRDLSCYFNQLTSLDVSKNTALTRLNCYFNQLTSLDVSKNTALTILDCGSNQLTSLDVSKNTALTTLSCGYNQLTSLDVSKNSALGVDKPRRVEEHGFDSFVLLLQPVDKPRRVEEHGVDRFVLFTHERCLRQQPPRQALCPSRPVDRGRDGEQNCWHDPCRNSDHFLRLQRGYHR